MALTAHRLYARTLPTTIKAWSKASRPIRLAPTDDSQVSTARSHPPGTSNPEYDQLQSPRRFEFAEYGVDRGTITRSATGTYTVDPDSGGPSPSFDFQDPTFNVRNLRGNAVLRWEYRGSALFVVWQQRRSDSELRGDFSPARDVGEIFRTVPTNILLVKATYWIGR